MRRICVAAGGRRLILIMFFLFFAAAHTGAGAARGISDASEPSLPGEGIAPPARLEVFWDHHLLSLDVRDAEMGEVFRRIALKTGIALTIGEGVGGRVSLTLKGVPLEEALRRLAASRAIIYEYDPTKQTMRVIGAGAFGAGDLRATPPDQPGEVSFSSPLVPETPTPGGAVPPEKATPEPPPEERSYDSRGRLLYKPREILVQFRPEATAAQIAALHKSLGSIVQKRLDHLPVETVLIAEGLSEKEAVALYEASEIVVSAERHALRYPFMTPDDPHYPSQWGLKKIGMEAAWDINRGKPGTVVAVVDTGIDYRHPDLAPNIWTNPAEIADNGSDDDQNGYLDDVRGWDFTGTTRPNGDNDPRDLTGHGTHVAGIIAASGNNGIGVAGLGWNLRVMPLKVMADGQSSMELLDIIEALDYARRQGARIVNCSFGGESGYSPSEYNAFDRLRNAGILAVCAAGNRALDNDTHRDRIYPASYKLDNIISVAASNSSDELAGSSNYGKISVDLMAPGEAIFSTGLCPESGACDSYIYKSGTSMAAPHVSGVAGLILSRNPYLKYTRVKSLLLDGIDKITSVAEKLVTGGRLNAAAALGRLCLPGDVIKDGRVGLEDVILALRITSGLETDASACRTADVNGDDQLGLAEALYGLQLLSGLRKQ